MVTCLSSTNKQLQTQPLNHILKTTYRGWRGDKCNELRGGTGGAGVWPVVQTLDRGHRAVAPVPAFGRWPGTPASSGSLAPGAPTSVGPDTQMPQQPECEPSRYGSVGISSEFFFSRLDCSHRPRLPHWPTHMSRKSSHASVRGASLPSGSALP